MAVLTLIKIRFSLSLLKIPYAASSALQALDARVPDQEPDFIVLPCPATARGAMEKCATR